MVFLNASEFETSIHLYSATFLHKNLNSLVVKSHFMAFMYLCTHQTLSIEDDFVLSIHRFLLKISYF